MELSKSATQGLGALALVAVLAGTGFFVVKPQIDEALSFQSQTQEVNDNTDIREIRLMKLETQSDNLDALSAEVNDLLLRVPSSKNVTDIAGAVVNALPTGVFLESFSHGELDATQPKNEAPEASLISMKPPIELKDAAKDKPKASTDDENGEAKDTKDATAVPAFAGAPFILTVSASSFETLNNFLDVVQTQK